ncbi:hypothetical protein ENLAB_11440 [Enterococcus innesii]|uniref:Uncharacterized protein n=1 Tax=Enterococcus innesii TaxID=2839759 RepID=A0ABN6NNL0_9ENTE|nr:hypothetical protein ENLAB_11440 [Enterococcus innesii]
MDGSSFPHHNYDLNGPIFRKKGKKIKKKLFSFIINQFVFTSKVQKEAPKEVLKKRSGVY